MGGFGAYPKDTGRGSRIEGDWPPAARQRLAAELRTLRPELSAAGRRDGERLAARIRDWLDLAGPRLPADTDRGALARFVLTVAEGATIPESAILYGDRVIKLDKKGRGVIAVKPLGGGGGPRLLTSGTYHAGFPAFGPGGRRLRHG
mgnify:CR=1 FL=1